MHIYVFAFLVMFAAACDGSKGTDGMSGTTGEQGPAGPAGPAGPQGPVGPQGPAGPQGPQGLQGLKGDTGSTGAQGPQGTPGTPGATGAQGPQGAPGPQGIPGATGAQGPQGATGAQGPAGAAGKSAYVYSVNNQQMGLLVNAAFGSQAYVTYGDAVTLVPDGHVVSLAANRVWYANSDCTGQSYVDDNTYVQFANYVYVGLMNELYSAPTSAAANVAVGSYNNGGGATCTTSSQGISGHPLNIVGTPTNLKATMPWHVVIK